MEHTDQKGLSAIKKELNLLQRLYRLYNDVIDSVDGYYNINWADINVEVINNELIEFGNRCRKLPKGLKVSVLHLSSSILNILNFFYFFCNS